MAKKKIISKETHRCNECRFVTTYTEFHTLSLEGKPTMGTCPYWKESKCVLLSQVACEHFKPIKVC